MATRRVSLSVDRVRLRRDSAAAAVDRQDEDAYVSACGREYVVALPASAGKRSRTLRAEYAYLRSLRLAVHPRREALLRHIENVRLMHERYATELACLEAKVANRARRSAELEDVLAQVATDQGFTQQPVRVVMGNAQCRAKLREHLEDLLSGAFERASAAEGNAPLPGLAYAKAAAKFTKSLWRALDRFEKVAAAHDGQVDESTALDFITLTLHGDAAAAVSTATRDRLELVVAKAHGMIPAALLLAPAHAELARGARDRGRGRQRRRRHRQRAG